MSNSFKKNLIAYVTYEVLQDYRQKQWDHEYIFMKQLILINLLTCRKLQLNAIPPPEEQNIKSECNTSF